MVPGCRARSSNDTSDELYRILHAKLTSPVRIIYGEEPNTRVKPVLLKQNAHLLLQLKSLQSNISYTQSQLSHLLLQISQNRNWEMTEEEKKARWSSYDTAAPVAAIRKRIDVLIEAFKVQNEEIKEAWLEDVVETEPQCKHTVAHTDTHALPHTHTHILQNISRFWGTSTKAHIPKLKCMCI